METLVLRLLSLVWNGPVVVLCLGAAFYFSYYLKFIQFKSFRHAIELIKGKYDNPNEAGQISHFQALTAALSATIGLGNIAGVAIAIATGGPGAIFWMWIVGLLSMATKFVECTLGTKYRSINEKGIVRGGPMYYISQGISDKRKFLKYSLAKVYAILMAFCAFGAGAMFQSNQAAATLFRNYQIEPTITGIVLVCLGLIVSLGGIKRIGSVTATIVPVMCLIYIIGALTICLMNISAIPEALLLIVTDAFTGHAAAGGFLGVLFIGVRRAIFSNESGLGSAAIAHSAVKTDYPIREGVVAALEPFIDTVVVCTATALVIILSGNFGLNMYQSVGKNTFSFESPIATVKQLNSWESSRDFPPSSSQLISFVKGNATLKYMNYTTNHSSHQINIKPLSDLLRFSYYNQAGIMRINIYDDYGTIVTSILSDGSFLDGDIEFIGLNKKNQWSHCLIKLDESYSNLTLEFVPVGNSVEWYIDSVESVKKFSGIDLTTTSFDYFFKGFGSIFISISVLFFAFSTIISWSYYGSNAAIYLFGNKVNIFYKLLFITAVYFGSVNSLDLAINISDLFVGLLVIPNIIALFILSSKVKTWKDQYFDQLHEGKFDQ